MLKYPDYNRIPYDFISPEYDKRYVDDINLIFKRKSELAVTEKMDGSQVGIGFKNNAPYVQSKNTHILEYDKRVQFYGLWSWVWENIEKISNLKGYVVFGEWLKVQHNLPYDTLKDFFVGFDVWDNGRECFLDYWRAHDFLVNNGFSVAPLLYEGYIKYEDLPSLVVNKKSHFASSYYLDELLFSDEQKEQIRHPRAKGRTLDRFKNGTVAMEGCVVKPVRGAKWAKQKESCWWTNCGKLVSQTFADEFDETAHWTSSRMRENKLMSWS